ncbi:MAG TPA: cell division protein FtsA [Candidatus Saccharimonadales bacterium]|nr:cell division protein FtsA [Candidatus Saccharimonadales bacterium]
MRDPATTCYVGLDIGTSTVRCVVGMLDQNNAGKLAIIGHGNAPNLGMRKGIVVHVDDAAEAIVQAITEAERVSGMRISHATVNVNGSHVSGMNSKGVIAISAANREITQEDRMRVEEAATIIQLPSNREIIQVFAKNYRLDGQDNIKDPVGMHGVRLEVDTHIVTAATPNLRNLDMALEKAQVMPNHHTLSSLAAAEAVLERAPKEAGTVLLDIGSGTTNMVVLEDGEVQHVAVLPIGGSYITNDLAIGLKTDLDIAEAVKITHANLNKQQTKKDFRVRVRDKDHFFDAEDVAMITEARVEELFEYVDKELARIHKSRKLPGGVVIVGGTAKLPGMAEFAKEKLQLAARIGKPHAVTGLVDTVADPAFAAATGLMILDMLLLPESNTGNSNQSAARALNFVDNLWRKIKP